MNFYVYIHITFIYLLAYFTWNILSLCKCLCYGTLYASMLQLQNSQILIFPITLLIWDLII